MSKTNEIQVGENCSVCRFSIKSRYGLTCHKNPPIPGEGQVGIFPIVLTSEWCGQYEWNRVILND